jgi:hypothetical protein
MTTKHSGPVVFIVAGLVGSSLASGSALASLGGSYASVVADRAHVAALLHSTAMGAGVVHRLTLPNGAVRREFADANGSVFAITWAGRSKPDLRQLLGPYFQQFQTGSASPTGRRTHRPLSLRASDLVVHSGGANGAFWGYAYLPEQLPNGFSLTQLNPVVP